jgi:hypothetical protein
MASALKAAQIAILTRFKTLWAARSPVAYPNIAFVPPEEGPWVRFDIVWGDGEPATMGQAGGKRNTLVGVIFVNVFANPGSGRGAANAEADAARDVFNRLEVSGVRFSVPSGPEPVRGDPEWEQVVVKIPFSVDELV